ncbi:MAG: benzoyl-CoA reductase subunit A [Acidobacteria bacterium]|nr:benzoyl-CoA reductase subunit A [Acidobacteriota bacterium]MCB9397477.1 benzoyl-CoA reductase subunit A [Acidobacteriota bacterium]
MKCFVGIDLGSTTTKAVILDENCHIMGRGITNSRSNYDVACQVAKTEAYIDARFGLLKRNIKDANTKEALFHALERAFRYEQYLEQSKRFIDELKALVGIARYADDFDVLSDFLAWFEDQNLAYGRALFLGDRSPKSDFFRDLVGSCYNQKAADYSKQTQCSFDMLLGLFDKSIIKVENQSLELGFEANIRSAFHTVSTQAEDPELFAAIEKVIAEELHEVCVVGTGYGRQRLPFPKEQIRSEILCHGLGAHFMFPNTRTVLDIGGQDTKAIQVDGKGIVTSFQMNDRCAAGCGRYLGYIAEEMNLALQELGPLANSAAKAIKINSTCTVFAGAELRDRLSDGQKREEILLGLHRAIIYRALSLLARSGGINDEFTFTGGVAKNEAALNSLKELVWENYGREITINVAPDSIFTGAIGAAIFALREVNAHVVGAA